MIPGRTRWICPTCARPTGAKAGGLAPHQSPETGTKCTGTGWEVATLDLYVPQDEPPPVEPEPVALPPVWVPAPQPVDVTPFRRWRALGWTREQIAAVTGPGALW